MKQTKKHSWNYKYILPYYAWITLGLIAIVLIVIFQRAYFPTTKQYCNYFPDKCVREWKIRSIDCDNPNFINNILRHPVDCTNIRKKTQVELDIDENEQYCRVFGIVYGKAFQKDYRVSDNKCVVPLNSIYQEGIEPYHGDWQNATIINFKNECEKGNPDWIEETECIEEQCIPKSDIFCSSNDNPEWDVCGNVCQRQCIKNKTICREKTEVEKCVDLYIKGYSCEQLEFWMKACIVRKCREDECKVKDEAEIYQNLKQAWRQKEC